MSPRLKAQMALEFLLLVAFFLLVLVIAIGYFASLQQTELTNREYLLGREVAARIADEVHTALVSGPGYEKTINLPPTIAGSAYTMRITNSQQYATAYVEIRWARGGTVLEYSFPLASRNLWREDAVNLLTEPIDETHPMQVDPAKSLNIRNPETSGGDGMLVFRQS